LEQGVAQCQIGLVPQGLEAGLAAVVLEDVDEVLQAGGTVDLFRALDQDCCLSVCIATSFRLVITLGVLDVGRAHGSRWFTSWCRERVDGIAGGKERCDATIFAGRPLYMPGSSAALW
jgi:hypothetical protein